jgi:hypothetical protein
MEWLLKDKVLSDPQDFEDTCEFDEDIEKFHAQWEKVRDRGTEDPERKKLASRLVRYALTDDQNLNGDGDISGVWWYSLCFKAWEESQCKHHCPKCKSCKDWREWHCGACDRCTEGMSIPCECGGVSETYHEDHRDGFF